MWVSSHLEMRDTDYFGQSGHFWICPILLILFFQVSSNLLDFGLGFIVGIPDGRLSPGILFALKIFLITGSLAWEADCTMLATCSWRLLLPLELFLHQLSGLGYADWYPELPLFPFQLLHYLLSGWCPVGWDFHHSDYQCLHCFQK